MKKVLFMSLAMAVALTGFAQRANVSNAARNASATAQRPSELRQIDGSAVQGIQFSMPQNMVNATRSEGDFDEYTAMTTHYDLQSNSALGNRIAVWPDGSAAFTATWDHSGNTGFPDRGTGYNFYSPDTKGMGDEPEVRQEPMKSGWPSIAACGDGEILCSHATGVNLYYRPVKGQGEWELIHNWGSDYGSPTWPRVVVSGPNDEYIHVVMAKQISVGDGYDNHIYYSRVKRTGDTWEIGELVDFPGVDNTDDGEYRNQLSADDYVMDANGNNVVVMFSSYTTEVFYMISHDNGETWERQIIAPYPILGENGEPVHAIAFADYPEGMTDTIRTSDNSHSVTIDNNGVVHATFALFTWKVADSDSYTYWPANSYGIVYWNSNYTNEQGGHEIPVFGTFSGDAAHTEWMENGIGYTLYMDRIDELAEADGRQNLNLFGYVDENGNGEIDYENVTGATWHYRSLGLATMPSISVDNLGDICIAFSVWSENRVCQATSFSYRSVYVAYKDFAGEWMVDEDGINMAEDFMHELDEQYPCVAATHGYNGTFWIMYSADDQQGLYLDINDTYPNSNGGELTENYMYACLIRPESLSVNEQEAINPVNTTRLYPNPATDVLNIEVSASQASEMTISVYNIMGQMVMSQNTNISTGMNTRSISTSELSSGIYFMTVKANGFENTMKFIVR